LFSFYFFLFSLIFLLPMNEVNMKYWFSDFKNFFYKFSGRIKTFYRRKTGFYEKKKTVALPRRLPWFHGCPNEFCPAAFCFQVRDFYFRITEGIGLTGVNFHFWPQKQILSGSCQTNFWLLFHVKNLPIFMFLGLIWCKILCWAQKSLWGLKCNRASWEPKNGIHQSEILCWTQKNIRYGVWNATTNHWSPKIWTNFNFEINKDYWHVFKYQSTIFNHLGKFMKFNCGYATHFFLLIYFTYLLYLRIDS
jgi:hypothetical protein